MGHHDIQEVCSDCNFSHFFQENMCCGYSLKHVIEMLSMSTVHSRHNAMFGNFGVHRNRPCYIKVNHVLKGQVYMKKVIFL